TPPTALPELPPLGMPGSSPHATPLSVGISREAVGRFPLSADQVGQRGRYAAIRHVHHVDSRHGFEQLGGHVGHASNASRGKADLGRIGFGMRYEFGDRLGRKRWMNH